MTIPTKVQTAHNSGTGTSVSVTLNGVTAGNLVWFGLVTGGQAAPTSVTDSNGTPVLVVNSSYTLFGNNAQYIVANAAAGTHTITANFAASTSCVLFIAEYSGVATSAPVDGSNQKSSNTGTAITSNSVTPSVANDLVMVLIGQSGASHTYTSFLGGVTQEDILNPGPSGTWADLVDTGTGAISSGATSNGSSNWSCSIALFLAGTAPPPTIVDEDAEWIQFLQAA